MANVYHKRIINCSGGLDTGSINTVNTIGNNTIITTGGNIGIGKINPSYLLDVDGAFASSSITTGNVSSTNLSVGSLIVGTNLSAANLSFTVASAPSTTAAIGHLTSSFISTGSLVVTTISSATGSATLGSVVSSNVTVGTLNFTTVSAGGATASIGTLVSTNVTATNFRSTFQTTGGLIVTQGSIIANFNSHSVANIVTTGGNVGIDTTAPKNRLHIHNNSISQEVRFILTDGTTTDGTNSGLQLIKASNQDSILMNYENEALSIGTNNRRVIALKNQKVEIGQIQTSVPITSGLSAHYNGTSWTGTQLNDLSGNGRNVLGSNISGTINVGADNGILYLYGDTNSRITFRELAYSFGGFQVLPPFLIPTPIFIPNYTLFHITKYNGTNKQRILTHSNYSPNWLSGHWSGVGEVAFHEGWLGGSLIAGPSTNNWVLSTDQWTIYRANGNFQRNTGSGTFSGPVTVSINSASIQESSDWALAEILFYDRILTASEIQQVESWLMDKYSGFTFTTAVTYPTAFPSGSVVTDIIEPSFQLDVGGDINFTGSMGNNGVSILTPTWLQPSSFSNSFTTNATAPVAYTKNEFVYLRGKVNNGVSSLVIPTPFLSSATSGGYVVRSSSNDFLPEWDNWKAFDGFTNTGWHTPGLYLSTGVYNGNTSITAANGIVYRGEWIELELPTSTALTNISIRARSGWETTRAPRDWYVFGSSAGNVWNLVHQETGSTYSSTFNPKSFSFLSDNSYKHYRLMVNRVGNFTGGNSEQVTVNIMEIQFTGAPKIFTLPVGYRPSQPLNFFSSRSTGSCMVLVSDNGDVSVRNNISFPEVVEFDSIIF